MRKILLLAGIFTFFMNNTVKAEEYYKNDGYYYQDKPRYVERIEYREPVRQGYRKASLEYQEQYPRYERIKNNEKISYQRNDYQQYQYYENEKQNKIRPYIGLDIATSKIDFGTDDWVVDNYNGGYAFVGALSGFITNATDINRCFVNGKIKSPLP